MFTSSIAMAALPQQHTRACLTSADLKHVYMWVLTARNRGVSHSRFEACIDNVYTLCQLGEMAKARCSSIDVAERPDVSEAKGSINLRIEAQTRQMIDDAAAILGKTRTEFMIESARSFAIDVLLDQRLFVLDDARYGAFVHALDNPPAPGPKLRALLRRNPPWEA
jgi:uncharacterized protein (DUF1778 family)